MAHVEATRLDAEEETHHYEFQRTRPLRLTRKKPSHAEARRVRRRGGPEFCYFSSSPLHQSLLRASASSAPPRECYDLRLQPDLTKFATLEPETADL